MNRIFLISIFAVIISCNNQNSKEVSDSNESPSLIVNFQKPIGKTFEVDNVELADTLLKIDTAKNVFENKIGKEILFFPEEHNNFGLVNCPNNGLIQTIQECYDNHRPLILTPDIIWLAICQGVSIHINENYDSLKNIIFIENKPDKIIVRNDSLEFSAKHWKNLIASFSEETKKYTNDDYYSFFVSEFSTTTAIDKTAYQVTLLESYKKAFEYIGDSGCGIPSITITGEKNDWLLILEKLDKLDEIGLSDWAKNLKPLIIEFINVYDNNPNKEFWQNIYKNASEYNGFYISGWIIKLFPYIKELESKGVFDEERGETRVNEVFKPNMFLEGNNYILSTLSTDNFPSGIAKIDVTWNNYFKNEKKEIEVSAGFFAIKQYSDKTLEPFITWTISEKNSKKPNHKIARNRSSKLNHKNEYWSPHIAGKIIDSAIYDIKNFTSQQASLNYIKSILLDSLSLHNEFNTINFAGDTLELIILYNGTIGETTLFGKNGNAIYEDYFEKQLHYLPEKWFPALTHPSNVLDGDFSEEENNIKIRANSMVKIIL